MLSDFNFHDSDREMVIRIVYAISLKLVYSMFLFVSLFICSQFTLRFSVICLVWNQLGLILIYSLFNVIFLSSIFQEHFSLSLSLIFLSFPLFFFFFCHKNENKFVTKLVKFRIIIWKSMKAFKNEIYKRLWKSFTIM